MPHKTERVRYIQIRFHLIENVKYEKMVCAVSSKTVDYTDILCYSSWQKVAHKMILEIEEFKE